MAKNFPFFKFTVSEWLTGDIVFENFNVQGLFINICAIYWHRDGHLSLEDINKRFKERTHLPELLSELIGRFIFVKDGFISINFLDEQLVAAGHVSKTNSDNGKKGGRPRLPKDAKNKEKKPNAFSEKAKKSKEEQEEEKEQEVNKNIKGTVVPLDFDKLLEYINNSFDRKFKLINEATRKKFNARLKDGYTALDIKTCIDNLKNVTHHKEKGFQYCTPEFISRSETLEKYSQKKENAPAHNGQTGLSLGKEQ